MLKGAPPVAAQIHCGFVLFIDSSHLGIINWWNRI